MYTQSERGQKERERETETEREREQQKQQQQQQQPRNVRSRCPKFKTVNGFSECGLEKGLRAAFLLEKQ